MSKLPTDTADIISDTQDLVLGGLPTDGQKINLPGWVDALRVVAETPEDVVKATLGNTGIRLQRFAIRVNPEHPDLESYFSELGNPAVELFKSAADVLVAASADKAKNKDLADVEKDFLATESWMKIIRPLGMPRTRLLAGLEDRKTQRGIKKQIKSVGLKSIFQGGENTFYGRPAHFKRFARNSGYWHTEMKELQERQDMFASKHMNEMAHAFAKRMRALEESISDTLGFFRIKPDEAAVILARLHNFKWNDTGIVTISSKYFDGCHFWAEGATVETEEEKNDAMKKALILNTRFIPTGIGTVFFNYQPRMYPLPLWNARVAAPDRVQKVIDRSEHFAALNRTPFFDYYWVLVPSININHPLIQKTKDHYTIREGNVNVVYTDPNEAAFSLDAILVKEGYVVPIIIGERDGKCYFLSMWV